MSHSFFENQNNEMNQVLIDFFQSAFQIDVLHVDNATAFPTFEEVFGLLDLSLSRNAPFQSSRKINGKYTPQAIKRHLIILMALILKEKLCVPGYNHCYLIQNIEHNLITNNNIYFISTNYDILIDNVLGNFDYMIDYGFAAPLSMSCLLYTSCCWLSAPRVAAVAAGTGRTACMNPALDRSPAL